MTKAEIEDARAVWLGYQNADHYLTRAAEHLRRRKTAHRWVWSHYRTIFKGQPPKGRRR